MSVIGVESLSLALLSPPPCLFVSLPQWFVVWPSELWQLVTWQRTHSHIAQPPLDAVPFSSCVGRGGCGRVTDCDHVSFILFVSPSVFSSLWVWRAVWPWVWHCMTLMYTLSQWLDVNLVQPKRNHFVCVLSHVLFAVHFASLKPLYKNMSSSWVCGPLWWSPIGALWPLCGLI